MKVSSVFGRTLQLVKLTALYSIYSQNQLNLILVCNGLHHNLV